MTEDLSISDLYSQASGFIGLGSPDEGRGHIMPSANPTIRLLGLRGAQSACRVEILLEQLRNRGFRFRTLGSDLRLPLSV